jgi:hypothetical protein
VFEVENFGSPKGISKAYQPEELAPAICITQKQRICYSLQPASNWAWKIISSKTNMQFHNNYTAKEQ